MTIGTYQLLIGDVRDRLRDVRPGSVQTCITSPPYWGLRSYATGDRKHQEIGSEPTPEAFVATMVAVFGLVRETLRDDGTLWLNLGDSYANETKWGGQTAGKHAQGLQGTAGIGRNRHKTGLDGSQQLLMPHRVAMALQADCWYLRSTVIWHKRNPMAESLSGWRWMPCRVKIAPQLKGKQNGATQQGRSRDMSNGQYIGGAEWSPCPGCDKCRENGGLVLRRGKWRPTTGHEYVFLFSKSPDYYADAQAVAEAAVVGSNGSRFDKGKTGSRTGGERTQPGYRDSGDTRNPRTVYSLSAEPYKGSHFATFPSELVRRLLLATSAEQCCSACGACYAPRILTERIPTRPGLNPSHWKADETGDHSQRSIDAINRDPQRHIQRTSVLGHLPTCDCHAPPGRCVVLDPFAGSGTTLQVATHYGRDGLGCELSDEYAALAHARIAQPPRCLLKELGLKTKKPPRAKPEDPLQRTLFQ